jgi:hypothetical protein
MDKLRWAVQAGDQVGDSEDDQPCGEHFIDKDLECHDGDAHRPTPGKNPYFQGDRKGPQDKSKTPQRESHEKNQKGHERDRTEHTKQNRERLEVLLDQGYTPESLGREQVNRFADLLEKSQGRDLTDKDVHTLSDLVRQEVGRRMSQDAEQQGIHDPLAPKGYKGPKGREDARPDSYHDETSDDHFGPSGRGGPEGGGLYDLYKDILKNRVSDGGRDEYGPGDIQYDADSWEEPEGGSAGPSENPGDSGFFQEGPSQNDKNEQEKWDAPDYQGNEKAGPAPKREKGVPGPYEYQDRHVDEWDPDASPEETTDYQRGERRRQTSKEYKRKRDAGDAKVPKAKSKKKAAPKKKAAKKKAAKKKAAPKKKAAKKKAAPKKKAAKKAKSSLAPQLTWGRIMQDRVDDNYQSPKGGCPSNEDVAEGRPCGDGEDPEKGKCNPNMSPEPTGRQPNPRKPEYDTGISKGPQSDLPKAFKPAPKEGMGLKPTADPAREQRMGQHVSTLTQDDGSDHNNTANGMGRMMGSRKPRQLDDGGLLVGSPAASPEQAKQQNDDYKDTLTKSGWENQSDMGGSSTWRKGNTTVQLKMGGNKGGQQGNQMKVVGPPQPKKKGLFR